MKKRLGIFAVLVCAVLLALAWHYYGGTTSRRTTVACGPHVNEL